MKPSTCVVVGTRPRVSAIELLGHMPPGDEAELLVLGTNPTGNQRRLTEEALRLAAQRGFVLTATMVSRPEEIVEHTLGAATIRIVAGRRERRSWQLDG